MTTTQEAVTATLLGYLELGNDVVQLDGGQARLVRNPAFPLVYDANHASTVRAMTPDELDAVLAAGEDHFAGLDHRTVKLDPGCPPGVEARLVLDGYDVEPELQLLLDGPVRAEPRPVAIRTVTTDDDWATVLRLTRQDHEEEAAKQHRAPWPVAVTEQLVATKRAKGPDLRFFLATEDGEDCAFFSAWPGAKGSVVGKVEDLYTLPAFRRRGVATALIVHAVADARERGAGPVLIGAVPADTPRLLYSALGFRPMCVLRSATLSLGQGAD